ncbi:GTP-binding protein, partial [Candidatus Saccharibacteria bacterium]|nr:GTP-binding protein [Candidatus Saccharibacteria bacterium]
MSPDKIRNFCIIAHIDHGKSTLADRMMELTGTVEKREMRAQLLDSMELEREKGITIKLTPVTMSWKGYELNLIDTPGHVDFSYEVSRSLEAVEIALLVVDATQGIQAQTLANVYLALEQDLKIIPVLNKIDLPAADVEKVTKEIVNLLGCSPEDILLVSAKTGEGVDKVLDQIISTSTSSAVQKSNDDAKSLRALIFDSYFDDYRGVVLYVRIFNGELNKNSAIHMMAAGTNGLALEVGKLTPKMSPKDRLTEGEIGYIVTNLKTTREAKVGDTVTLQKSPAFVPLPGYKNVLPFVYAGFFPVSNEDYKALKEAIEKLALSDSALQFEPENSPILGFGLRIGFLGLLHMDIIR